MRKRKKSSSQDIKVGPFEVCAIGFGTRAYGVRGAPLGRGFVLFPSKAEAMDFAKQQAKRLTPRE